jgi:uncharacterized membrane protein YfcA
MAMADLVVVDVTLALAAAVMLASGIVQGYSGFGAALLIMPLMSLLYTPVEALAIAGIAAGVGVTHLSWLARRDADWRELLPVLIGSTVAIPIGTYFLLSVDPIVIRRAVGGCVLAATVLIASGWVYRGSRGPAVGGALGAVSGAVSGLAAAGIPIAVAYFMSARSPAAVQRANIVTTACSQVVLVTAAIAVGGAMDASMVVRGILFIAPFMVGAWLGRRLFAIAPDAVFRRVAIALLVAASVVALVA